MFKHLHFRNRSGLFPVVALIISGLLSTVSYARPETAKMTGADVHTRMIPVPTSLVISGQPNPVGTTSVVIAPASFTGTDANGTITTIRYTSFPTNITSISIGTTLYNASSFPSGGVTVPTGTVVRVDPIDGAVTAVISFALINSAGQEGAIGTVSAPFLVVTDFCNSQVLFFNEDFGAGTGFGPPLSTTTVPGYTYSGTDPINDGFYSILNNPDQGDDFTIKNVWLHGSDHTGNANGRMIVINGSNPAQIAYTQTVSGMVVGRVYSLRTYLTNIFNEAVLGTGEIKPNLILRVRDNANTILASISTGDVPATTTLTWLPYSMTFTATTTSVKFELVSNSRAGNGNDYALDDIQFFEVIQPVLSATSFASACPATSASISNVTASNQPSNTTLTWHSSATATAGNLIRDVTALKSGTYYAAFSDGTCYTKTSPYAVRIVPCANPDTGLTISSVNSGTVVNNVATNDFVNGQPATLGTSGNATIAQSGNYPTGVTLNTTTGSLSVAQGTAPGSYTVTYQLCDKLTTPTCTTTTATITVTAPPVAGSGTANGGTTPSGTTQVSIPASAFTSTTPSSSSPIGSPVSGIRITQFPAGATSIVIKGTTYTTADVAALTALVIPTDANGNPTVTIMVDPTATTSTTVTIPFKAVDAAGVESANTGSAVIIFTVAMPVSLIGFGAKVLSNNTVLTAWSTSWERNNQAFIIERSKDLIVFEEVAQIRDVTANQQAVTSYQYVDANPYRGTSYYRLRQVDQDGTSQTFNAVGVVINASYGVYPNPVLLNSFTLELDEPAGSQIYLYTLTGSELLITRSDNTDTSVHIKSVSPLSKGVYLLKVTERGSSRTHRLIVQ